MFKKSIKCYIYLLAATLVLVLAFPTTREAFTGLNYLMASAYLIGASIWIGVPGMINFWLCVKRGSLKWGTFSLVTSGSVITMAGLIFYQQPINFVVIMSGGISVLSAIGQLLVLIFGMGIKAKNDDRIITVQAETLTEKEATEIEPLLMGSYDDYLDRYRSGE